MGHRAFPTLVAASGEGEPDRPPPASLRLRPMGGVTLPHIVQ